MLFSHICVAYSFPSFPSPSLSLPAQLCNAGKVTPHTGSSRGQGEGAEPVALPSSGQHSPKEESWGTGQSRVLLKETKALARVCACFFTRQKDLQEISRLQIRIKATLFSALQSIHLQVGQALLQSQGCPPSSLQLSTPGYTCVSGSIHLPVCYSSFKNF